MPLLIVDESYNGENSLIANAGDWVEGQLDFSIRFEIRSSISNKITYNVFGNQYMFSIQNGDFGDSGFLAGDVITLNYTFYASPLPLQNQSFSCTILYINGNEMFVDQPLGLDPSTGLTFTHVDGRQFPTDNYVSSMIILANKQPASSEFEFNLSPNGTSLLSSLIDSELNRFELPVVTGIPTGVPQEMNQLVNKSGGLLKDVFFTLVSTPGSGWRNYKVTYKFFQWAIIQNGFAEPSYYDQIDCVAPICRIKCFAEYGNPNGVQIQTSQNLEANTGGFDENYNGGLSLYTSLGTSWVNSLGDQINGLDNSGTSSFTALITAPNQLVPTSTYRIGLVWRPINSSYYQSKPTDFGDNLLINAPEVDFIADGSTDPTLYQGYEDDSGARWDFQNLKFEITGVDEITVSGDIIPNTLATVLFSGVPDGGRRSTLWVSLGDQTSDGTVYSKRVSLKIFDEDNYDAPTKGVQIPNVVDEVLLDHSGLDITAILPQTTTEDDVLYISNFKLVDGVEYEGVRARIYAFNTVTEESFTLEDIFFNFTGVPFIAGQFQPNLITDRGFNLPPTTDRNHVSLVRNPLNDSAGFYGLKLEYGYLSRWEYWLSQQDVDNDFFDIAQMWDGKNKDWQRFSNSGDWKVYLSYYTRLNGVDDYNNKEIGIRPYEDDVNVSTVPSFYVPSSGITPNDLIANEIIEVTTLITWLGGYIYTNAWAEATIEDDESGNRWVISSVLDQGNVSSNPLKPMAGLTLLDLDFPSSNIARLRFIIDTNLINVNNVSLSYRIYSEDRKGKTTAMGDILKTTTTGLAKTLAP